MDLRVIIEVDGGDSTGSDIITVRVGGEITALVSVSNVGNGDATNVRISMPIPSNTEFVSAQYELVASGAPRPLDATMTDDTANLFVRELPAGYKVAAELTLRAIAIGDVPLETEAGCNELAQTARADYPGEIVVVQDDYSWIITTSRVPCGAAGAAPLLMMLCVLPALRRRHGR